MFIRFPNLSPGDCLPGATCLYSLRTYLLGLFFRAAACFPTYLKVTPGDCLLRMKLVYTVSNPTYGGLSVQGADGLYRFKTYLMGTVGWVCSQFIHFLNIFRNESYNKTCLEFSHLKNIQTMFWSLCVR